MASSKKKKLGPNPKDVFGLTKTPLNLVPAIGTAWEAAAFADGARKYSPYNWRKNAVIASIYAAAAKRHIDLWLEGELNADDSSVRHLGHAKACLGILLDAEATGNLIDDRPLAAADALKATYAEITQLLTKKKKK